MKTPPKPTVYDCVFFMEALEPLHPDTSRRKHPPTDNGCTCYIVERILKANNKGRLTIILVCANELNLSVIHTKIPALELIELTEEHIEERIASDAKETLSTRLSEKKNMEVALYYCEGNLLGDLSVNGQIMGDMVLKAKNDS